MKIYLAGQITGVKDYRAQFGRYARALEKAGHIVLNPAELPEGMSKADYMRICFAMIDTADMMLTLPYWDKSKGAKLEVEYCDYVDTKQMRYADFWMSENGIMLEDDHAKT